MAEVKPVIIPTRTRQKIPHDSCYPIGAEKTSHALAGASQFGDLVLHFRHDYGRKHDARQYRFLQAGYSSLYKEWTPHFPDRNGLPLFSEWQVEVFPVPRFLRHRVQQDILNNALAEIRMWLDKRISTCLTGSETLTFFYDEDTEEFASKADSRLQPDRV
jgi:hypothetical protein